MISTVLVMITQGLALAAAAPAQSGMRPPSNDPNEVVCVRETQIGSRLSTGRVCRTREQWDEVRRQARTSVERAQNQTQTSCQQTPTMQC
jgi:hypothetical protein